MRQTVVLEFLFVIAVVTTTQAGSLNQAETMHTYFQAQAEVNGFMGTVLVANGDKVLLERRNDGTLWFARQGWELQLLPTEEGFVVSSGVAVGPQISFEAGDKPTMLFKMQDSVLKLARR